MTQEPASSRESATGSPAGDSRKRYRGLLEGLLEHSLDAITLIDRVSRRFIDVSESFCALTGYSRVELVGRTAIELGLVADDAQHAAVTASADRGRGGQYEAVIRRKDGAQRSLEMSTQLLNDNEIVLTIGRDVTRRRRLEAQLRASEERFQTAVRAMLDSFLIVSPVRDDQSKIIDFRFEYVNDAYCALVERAREQLLGHTAGELFPGYPESDRFALYLQVALTGEPVTSMEVTGVDDWAGGTLAGRVIDTVIASMGENLVVYGRDVTDRWHAQQGHAAAEARLRDVIESAPDAMVIVNADGEIVLVNAQTERLFGYTRAELIGQTHELLVPEPLRNRHREHRADYATNPRARSMGADLDLFARRKDGTEFPVEISLSPLGTDNESLVCSAIRDITARRQIEYGRRLIEQELRSSRARLAEAERVAGIGSWERDLTTDVATFSDGLLEIHGLSADQFDGSFATACGLVYPEDRDRVQDTIDRAIAERASYSVEYRAIRTDGRVRTLRGHGDVIVDDTGEPVRVVAIVQDITDAKLTKEALQSTSADLGRRANELQQLALRTADELPDIPHAPLTARQLEIMQLIAQGLTNAAIAERLVLTEGTIKWHVRQVLAKTNSSNRAEAIAHVLGTPR